MNITGKRVLITGGSSGIGLVLAQVPLAKGAKVAISGRRPEVVAEAVRSLQTGSVEIHGIAADVPTPRRSRRDAKESNNSSVEIATPLSWSPGRTGLRERNGPLVLVSAFRFRLKRSKRNQRQT